MLLTLELKYYIYYAKRVNSKKIQLSINQNYDT